MYLYRVHIPMFVFLCQLSGSVSQYVYKSFDFETYLHQQDAVLKLIYRSP